MCDDIGRKVAVLPRSKPISPAIGSQRADVFVNVFDNKFPKVPHRHLARFRNFSVNDLSQQCFVSIDQFIDVAIRRSLITFRRIAILARQHELQGGRCFYCQAKAGEMGITPLDSIGATHV